MALIADSPTVLQCMIDTAASYAMKWHYCFNVSKSVVLVVGESPTTRAAARSSRQWFLCGSPLSEVDMTKHLGIVLSVNSPHAHRATVLTTSFRSCYYGLATLCARFTTLNPCTSLFLLKSFCLPLLCFSFELWSPPQSTILVLEQALNKALRTIIGVPVHAPTLGIHLLLGTIPVNLLLKLRRLTFLINTLHLPPSAPALQILKSRLNHSGPSLWLTTISVILR